jgi:hypothetical protein
MVWHGNGTLTQGPNPWGRAGRVVLRAVLPHPSLWWAGACAVGRLAPKGWWHRSPFLPLPAGPYWHFRLVTAYGGTGDERLMVPDDVVTYLRWCRRAHSDRG